MTIYVFMYSSGDVLSYCSDVVRYYTCQPIGGNYLMNKTILGLFLALNYCIHSIIEFYLFVCSRVSYCKFWCLEDVR